MSGQPLLPPATQTRRPLPAALGWLALGTLVVAAFAVMLSLETIRQGEASHRQQALIATENLCRLLEHDVAHIIGKADQALQTVVQEAERDSSRGLADVGHLDEVRAYQHSLQPELLTLRIADARGDVRWGLDAAHPKANIADREYFIRARDNPRAELVIAGPFVSRTTGQWVIFLARRINRPDASFAGIAYGAIPVEQFRKLFAEMQLGHSGAISLRTTDFVLVSRFSKLPGGQSAVGSSNVSPELKQRLQGSPLAGTYIARTALDQVERANAYRKVGSYPFVVLVGLATDDYLENWRQDVTRTVVLAALLVVATFLSAWSIHRSWQRHQAGEAERQARQAAEAASRAKDQFLASMSHELRTPLNGILGYAQLLRRNSELSLPQRVGLDTILQSGRHLLSLINDLLDFAKIEAGKLDLQPQPVHLPALLAGVAGIVRVPLEEKNLSFNYQSPPDLPVMVMADDRRLRQVLLNLLSNAIKFTDRGRITLGVRLLGREGGSTRIRFEVADTGVGMAPQDLERSFQPFEQLGEAGRRASGTGLGLAISRRLVRLMGSDLAAESRPGEGSRFWFDLDLSLADAVAAAEPPSRLITGYAGRRRRVLVVDDVAGNRAMLRDLLQSLGFAPSEAANGEEAVAAVTADPPDLVLMDVVMPVMDGIEATRRIRQLPGGAALPVIALSASASGQDEAASAAAGANRFLPKPIDQDCLLQAMGELMELQWLEAPVPAPRGEPQGEFALPPRETLECLHRLALTGNMRQIREYVARLGEADERHRAFASRIDLLTRGYQSKAIVQLVQQALG